VIDERFTRCLHVETLRRAGMHVEHDPKVLFQASTIGALLEGAYDGDVSFAELAENGTLGLGTLNGLDGEMIAIDGRFFRADVEGRISEIDPEARTPFAVVVPFAAERRLSPSGPLGHDELQGLIDDELGDGRACALRVDGRFSRMRARSVPPQRPPFRPLAEAIAEQRVFELGPCEGSLVGFRFPDHSDSLEVAGYHLHFIDAARRRGGHVLDLELTAGTVLLDPATDLHIELPPGVDLKAPHLDLPAEEAIRRVEG
jgi:acetolactate decarboxylase